MIPTRILIVDDEVGASRLLKANLEMTGRFQVVVENRPENAAAAARQFKPHVVLADVIMPRLSGTSLAAALQADPELQSIRIMFVTAAEHPLIGQSTSDGLHRFPCLVKPVSVEEIVRQIENILPPQE